MSRLPRRIGAHLGDLVRRFQRLTKQPMGRQALAVEAGLVLVGVKALMKTLPYRYWRPLLRVEPRQQRGASATDLNDVLWAVDRVSHPFPDSLSCLPRAVTAQLMLLRRRCATTLCIGVLQGTQESFEAHAWLELNGEVILGAVPNLERYVRLRHWPSRKPPR